MALPGHPHVHCSGGLSYEDFCQYWKGVYVPKGGGQRSGLLSSELPRMYVDWPAEVRMAGENQGGDGVGTGA